MLNEAIAYAWGRSWQVFALSPGSKKPLPGTRGFLDASADITTVARLWSQHSTAGIAMATGEGSHVWVLDVDAHHGGMDALSALAERLGDDILDTRIHATPNGGMHLFYQWPTDLVIPRKINAFKRQGLAGIDLLGNDGYVVLPPTKVVNNAGNMAVYTVVDGQDARPTPPPLLDAIREVLAPSIQAPTQLGGSILAPPKHGTAGIMGWLANVPPGGQDDAMSWAVRALRDEGCTATEAADLLWQATQQMSLGGRPWAESDIRRHIRSAYGG